MTAGEVVLTLWVIFDHPYDYPYNWVLRGNDIIRGATEPRPQDHVYLCNSLEEARAALPPGMHCLGREPDDDPKIFEVWV